MTASPDPVSPGDLIGGKYRVERVLGRGGMGVVVQATHAELGQRVAIKFLLKEAMESDGVAARFLREARTMVQLTSEHVARVSDVGTHQNGAPYMVMEYLEGQDLSDVIQGRGPLPAPEAVDYLLQACEAVAEAHSKHVVHRDLKPGNLFLTRRPDGSPLVKVLDFGISKAVEPSGNKLTVTAAVMGSPAYMSPEQVRSTTNVDQRSDVWALGVIAYELLSASLPFEAPTMSGMFAAIVASPMTPLASRRPDLHPELARSVERALVKEVEGRFQSVAELASALAPFGTEGARISSARITRQLGASGWEHAVSSGRGVGAVSHASPTSTTGPHVASGRSRGSRGLALVLGGVVLAVAAAAAGAYVVQQRSASPAAALPESVTPSDPAAKTPPTVPSPEPSPPAAPAVSVAAPEPAVTAAASASAAPETKAEAPATAAKAKPTAPRAPKRPPAGKPTATAAATTKPKFDPLGGAR